MDDHVLLQAYLDHGSEQAFADLVARHLPFVYATALRLVRDPHAAQDVAQTVFILLARKPRAVYGGYALPGWLYRTTQRAAWNALRSENRRRQRESEAMKLAEQNQEPAGPGDEVDPALDAALQCLSRAEQDAVLLHYYQGKSYREIGIMLGVNESAAHKRVERSLGKVRDFFARRGVTTTAALLASEITARAAAPLPSGLAVKITGASLAGAGTGLAGPFLKAFYTTMKIKTILMVAAAVSAAAFIVSQHREIAQLQERLDEQAAVAKKPARPAAVPASAAQSTMPVAASNVDAIQATLAEVIAEMQNGTFSDASQKAFDKFLAGLDNQGMAVALAYVDREGGSNRDVLSREILDQWEQNDPAAALTYAKTIGGMQARQSAVLQILNAWMQKDPNAATAWVQQLPPGSERDDLISESLKILARTDPEAAVKLAGPDASPPLLASLMASWAEKDPNAAIAQMLTLPVGDARTETLMMVGQTLSKTDTAAALNWANSLENETDKAAALSGILPALEPTQAMGYVAALSDPHDQFGAALGVMHSWVNADPAAPGEWIKAQPPGPAQQAAIRAYVAVLSPKNPAAAAPWAESIADEQTRTATVNRVFNDWTRTDPQAATTWLNQTDLSDADKQQILSQTNNGQ